MNINRLALNVGKTNFVIFRAKKKIYHNVTLILNRKAIEQKDHVKYLGVLMDEHLNWKKQIANVTKKISRGVGILAKLRGYVDPKLLKNIYHCIVFSHLSYGVEAWGSACATDLEQLPYSLKFSRPFYFRASNFRAFNFRAPADFSVPLIFAHPFLDNNFDFCRYFDT